MHFVLVLIAALLLSEGPTLGQAHARTYRVHGSVTNTQMVGIKDAQLEFTHGEVRFTEHTAADGTFSVSVPLGTYTLNAKANGFCPQNRDVMVAENDTKGALNLALLSCSDCSAMIIDFVEPRIEPDTAPPNSVDPHNMVFKYQEESLEQPVSSGIKPSVLFGRRTDLGEFIEYSGLDCPGDEKLAILRYNGGALTAKKLKLAKEAHVLTGEGEVIVVDRRGVSRGSTVQVNLGSEAPVAIVGK
jgi:hypothetical protein